LPWSERKISQQNRTPRQSDKTFLEFIKPRAFQRAAVVAVGALHLIGDKGLVALLRQQGYAVTRVY